MTEHPISFSYQGRYYKDGEITSETKQVWFVLHGYGQLAQYFIKKFSVLTQRDICVIAPEGLSRFYMEQFHAGTARKNDRVGATWMTRENRQSDINNYISFLNTVYDKELKGRSIPITVLGFSQGSATASRWVMNNQVAFHRLILWAGMFPADMILDSGKDALKEKRVDLVYGAHDPFITDERFAEMNVLSEKLLVKVNKIVFEGEHDIDQETLVKLIE
jgi:predicted esterase